MMEDSKPVSTPMECKIKLSKHEEGDNVDQNFFKSLVGSLCYLTYIRPNISSMRLESSVGTWKIYTTFEGGKKNSPLSQSDSDWSKDMDDSRSTVSFIFYMGDTAFTWLSKKQSIVTLSKCEAEYVVATSCAYHAIWLQNLQKKLGMPQEELTKILVDNKLEIAPTKNPIFHF